MMLFISQDFAEIYFWVNFTTATKSNKCKTKSQDYMRHKVLRTTFCDQEANCNLKQKCKTCMINLFQIANGK